MEASVNEKQFLAEYFDRYRQSMTTPDSLNSGRWPALDKLGD